MYSTGINLYGKNIGMMIFAAGDPGSSALLPVLHELERTAEQCVVLEHGLAQTQTQKCPVDWPEKKLHQEDPRQIAERLSN